MKHLIFMLSIFIVVILFYMEPSFASGLENIQSGLKRGTSAIQKIGYVTGSLMFIVGAIVMKFNSDRGRQVIISSIIGIILLSVGVTLPDTLRGFFQ